MAEKTKAVNPFIITVLLMLLVLFSVHSIPVLAVSLFLIPVLNAYLICNHSIQNTLYANFAAIIFCMVTSAVTRVYNASDLLTIAFLVFPGIVIGICFYKNCNFKETMFFSLVCDCLIFIITLAIAKYAMKINITEEIRTVIVNTFDMQTDILKNVYPDAGEVLSKFGFEIFNLLYLSLPGFVPFAVFVFFMFLGLIRYAFCKMVCTAYFVNSSRYADGFDAFRVGLVTNIALVLSVFLMLYATSAKLSIACTNVVLIIFTLYFITTVSVIEHRLKYKICYPFTRFLLIMFIIIGAIILTAIVPVANFVYIFVFFGFMDSLFDFRKLKDNDRR